jgi:TATA-box binding protein (TBP) (component of TFIID and TFIIIB)
MSLDTSCLPPGAFLLDLKSAAISNIVSTANFGCNFDLAMISLQAAHVRKTRFPASDIYLKFYTYKVFALLFETGNITASGALNLNEVMLRLQIARCYIEKCLTNNYQNKSLCNKLDQSILHLHSPLIRNVVIRVDVGKQLDIYKFWHDNQLNVCYFPDIFSGAIYKPRYVETTSKIRVLAFDTGKLTIVGAAKIEAAERVLIEVRHVLYGHTTNVVDVHASNRFMSQYETFLGCRKLATKDPACKEYADYLNMVQEEIDTTVSGEDTETILKEAGF